MNLWTNMRFLVLLSLVKTISSSNQDRIIFPDDDEITPQSRSGGFDYNIKHSPQSGIKTTHRNYGSSINNPEFGFPSFPNYGVKSPPSGVKTNPYVKSPKPNEHDGFHVEDVPSDNIVTHVKTVGRPHPVWFPHPGNPHPGHPQSEHPYPGQPPFGFSHPGYPYPGQPNTGHPYSGQPHPGHPNPGNPYFGHPHSDRPGHPHGIPLAFPNFDGFPGNGPVKTHITTSDRPGSGIFDNLQVGVKTAGVKTTGVKSFGVKTTSQTYSDHSYDIKKDTENFLFEAQRMPPIGGCKSFKKLPSNSNVKCQDVTQTCRVTCLKGYKFPTGSSSLQVSCVDNEWIIKDSEWLDIPSCEPVCMPACQNNGICIAPGLCKCPQNYHGAVCQHKKVFCPSYPPVPNNSNMSCNPSHCTIQCLKGYRFADGSQITNMVCDDGQWKHAKTGRLSAPECEPICDPPCQNGGTCQGYNSCLCLKKFRGPLCQYDEKFCNISNTGFNGQYSCTFKMNEAICMVSCPPGINFEFAPADRYICEYSSNIFKPRTIPKCVIPPGYTVITGQEKAHWEKDIFLQFGQKSEQTNVVKEAPLATFKSETDGIYSLYVSSNLVIKTPSPAMCATWGGRNVKTFDGLIYKTPLHCSHTLVQDSVDGTFKIFLKACPYGHEDPCPHALQIFFEDVIYTFSNEDGVVTLKTPEKKLPVPVQILGMRVVPVAHYVKIDFDKIGMVVYWDKDKYVMVEADTKWWERTSGLCGTFDMNPGNDLVSKTGERFQSLKSFVDAWEIQLSEEKDQCKMASKLEFEKTTCEYGVEEKGIEVCGRLVRDAKLKECVKQFDENALLAACVEDYCKCTNQANRDSCVCDTVSMLAKDCIFKGINLDHGWRNLEICPVKCDKGRVYSPCGPTLEPTCGFPTIPSKDTCQEGCYCPEGTVQYKGDCIIPEQCPCTIRNKEFKSGSKITKDCNTCTCEGGIWNCSDITCGARCGAIGDPHYVTFDGKRYDFMGKCSYHLLKTGDLSVEAENVPCPGSISAAMNLAPSTSSELPSCTKSVTIRLPLNGKDTTIKLAQGPVVYVDEREVEHYPKTLGNELLVIRQPSSTFVTVDFDNGIRVWWDGNTRVYIDAPPSFRNKTQGLCGTFNSNTQDDFLTPEGDIETAADPFAEKWRTKETCGFLSDEPSTPYPCDTYPEKRPTAEKYCEYILSEVFEECHWTVDPEPFYENCMYDVCACKGDVSACLCPILAAYGTECSRQGVNTNWRFSVKECSLECPDGQVYDECGDSCLRTCQDIARKEICKGHCVEGCRCPPGEYLNDKNECIPAEKCPCWYDGMSFEPGYKEVRPGEEFLELCTCLGGSWECKEATPQDQEIYPPSGALKAKCLAEPNSEFTKCVPNEPKTCKNMHKYVETFEDCSPGCVCKIGSVLDTSLGKCVPPEECSCHHGGRSYNDGDEIKEDCNTCKCKSGKWDCTTNVCASTCSVWGDSHFTTFDGKDFDFQGACDYVLSKGADNNGDGFTITIQNVLCGSLGVTCSKSVKIALSGRTQDSITLSSDPSDRKSIEKYKKVDTENPDTFTTYNAGVFLVAEVLDLGLQVKWDRGTRVYIKLDNKWKGKVSGLCGNYNDDAQDDMKTPSLGVESSPLIFGHSWKLQDYCAVPTDPINACKEHPERESWAHLKCGVLKSSVFKDCHSEVPYEKYLKRCVFDTCACDQGGDCECLCTALAAYAYACSLKGVEIKWRTPQLCPMQCDPHCSEYSPCTQPCPVETCDNFLEQGIGERMCLAENCFEGCHIKACEDGMIYLNDSFSECVPKSTCKPICMEKDGVVYYEGDITRSDDCQTCRCTRKKEICSGAPCTTPSALESTTPTPLPSHDRTEKPLDICDPTIPHQEFPGDCYKFLHCMQQPNGVWAFVEKTCGPAMMYNPNSMTCDHIRVVEILKPECLFTKKTSPTPSTHEPLIAEKCIASSPPAESPRDCHKYLQCVEVSANIWGFVEKTCPDDKMFNPLIKECDNLASVLAIKPICRPTYPTTETPNLCPPGKKWSECAIHCEKSCHYYKNMLIKKGVCNQGDMCEAGCIDINAMLDCATAGKLWRDEHSCVEANECPCMSLDGKLLKPHAVYESVDGGESKICQCLDNTLVCIPQRPVTIPAVESRKLTTTKPGPTITSTDYPLIIPTTVTPPKHCEEEDLVPMISGSYGLPDTAFAASSVLGSSFLPQYARLHSKPSIRSNGSWSPGTNDQSEYLQVTFPQPTPLYGVVMQGSPIFDQYVTLFKITYSYDGGIFHYITDKTGSPQVFKGPASSRQTKSSYFEIPVEAKVVRIYPLKWHGSISMRLELYGCSPSKTTVNDAKSTPYYPYTSTATPVYDIQKPFKPTEIWPGITRPVEPVCTDEMGVENGQLSPSQVKASSILWPKPVKGKKPRLYDMLKMNSPISWRPAVDTPNQYVLFDFLEPRNVTGVKTQGGPDGWVTSYKVMFSKNGKLWNKVITPDGIAQIFDANHDSDTPKTNYFEYPIQAQLIKVVPVEWQDSINMRIEPIGCFHPYPEATLLPEIEHVCPTCPDVEVNTLPVKDACKCKEPLFWDGKKCVDINMCPCIVNHISYDIGSIYENENCEECVCVLGGISQCTEKKCPPCAEGLRKDKSKPCACACEPCPPFQRICPSSGDCIPEDLWCNGYQDCEDDEKDCLKSTTPAPEVPKTEIYVNKTCPEPACPEGMEVQLTGNTRERQMSQMFDTSFVAVKSTNPTKRTKIASQMSVDIPDEEIDSLPSLKCPEYICIFTQKNKSNSCPLAQCREGYEVEYEKTKESKLEGCIPYACVPVRQKDAICKISGKTFNTFDGTEFKYDPCNHVIARDLSSLNWIITLNVNCSNYPTCSREVIIKDKLNDYALKLLPDLTVNLNGFDYTVRQLERTSLAFGFIISQPGSTILVVSKKHGFWVSYDESGDVKIGVSSKYVDTVDGLCGFYNDNPSDDKRTPDGVPAKNTAEFGNSWFSKEVPNEYCQPQVCTEDAETALQICNSIKHEVFGSCSNSVDYEAFISKCVEATCECLKGEKVKPPEKAKSCKCLALERFVKECLAVKPSVLLDTWRAVHDCEISCPPPLIYKDCYKRRCEPSCDTVGKNECPLLPDECFSGCFCPDGTVRKGETCVSVTECKDCVCDNIGKSKYVTYDRKNFTFDGNCTYLLSRDILVPGAHTFQVYATLEPCEDTNTKTKGTKSTCTKSLHILYGDRIIHLQRLPNKSLQILVNGLEVKTLPHKVLWLHINKVGDEILINLPESQVEVESNFVDNSFSIRVPSIKYGAKLEGLCGDCDGDSNNDLQANPKYTKQVNGNSVADIAETWQADEPKLGLKEEQCVSEDVILNDCIVPDPQVDPCLKIFDENLFGKCHFIVDPIMYISACQQDLCKHGPNQKGACESLAAYAKECGRNGICLNWRKSGLCPYDCPPHLEYDPCGCPETCDTVKDKDVFAVIDIRSDAVMEDDTCSMERFEGCFCPEGKVLRNDKCVPEKECTLCDDHDHYPGDIWFKDKCTECTCNKQGKVECIKRECSVQESVCAEGYYALKTSSADECCPKFICVPEPTIPPSITCPDAPPLTCGPGQNRKLLTGKNGCPQFVCECKPLSECEPLTTQRTLKPGEKLVTETIGCCPSQKIVCDKLQCPPKPKKCDNELYELIQDTKEEECCPVYKCAPPKNTCLVTINGVQTLKRFGDKWSVPNDPCTQKFCSFGPEGVLIELEQQEMCDINCDRGFKYTVDDGKCCGKCVQVMCILGDQLYKPGEVWFSEDGCTKFSCDARGNHFSITSYEETCPDVSDCPEKYRYKKGCCVLCKPVPESKVNCLPESLAEPETVELVQVYQPMHGLCINREPIRGFTECHGSCPSGSKFNRLSYGQDKICECCSIEGYQEMKVPLVCADGYKVFKSIQIPASCGCKPCDNQQTSAKMFYGGEETKSGRGVKGVKGVKG